MERLTLTPFGQQPVTAGLLATQMLADGPAPVPSFAKWELFHALCAGRHSFGISDRDLTVMNALLSFLPADALEDGAQLVVFPSNRTLAERAHGMAESTLRRHLAALVGAGLVLRHDSPNGKRYARRDADGSVAQAFGFDLRPLLVRAPDIMQAAEAARAEEATRKQLRERCVLTCRDAVKLLIYGAETLPEAANWDALDDALRLVQRALRRKLNADELGEMLSEARSILAQLNAAIAPKETEDMSGNDHKNERHLHNSKPNTTDLEPSPEKGGGEGGVTRLPLALVVKACPEVTSYRPEGIETWEALIDTAGFVRGMMGISLDAWRQACIEMGPVDAAITLAAMLERVDEITSPGGYLRALSQKAGQGAFSTGPMVMALLNRSNQRAA